MKFVACLTVLSICAFSATFAEEPQTPAAPAVSTAASAPAAAAPAEAAKAPAMDAVAPDAAAKAQKDKAAAEAEIKTMRARGYKPSTRNGMVVYCRPEGQLGTHFEKLRCNTMEELRAAELTGKEYVNSMQQQGSPTQFKGDFAPNPHQ
jgi:hypothetical protein